MESKDPLERAVQRPTRREIWTDEQFRAAREHDLAERTAPVGRVVAAVLACLALAALLTSAKLVEIAERQEFGSDRDRNVALAEGIDRAANFLSLNRPYDTIRDLRDANNDSGDVAAVVVPSSTTTSTTAPTTSQSAPAATTSVTTTTTTTTVPVGRTVTPDSPLRLYVAGDSQATYLGQAITTESGELSLTVEVDDRISTSLARPDYFDWPSQWAVQVASEAPEVVVLFIGANDHQDMVDADGARLVEGTEPWRDEWRGRLITSLDILTGEGRVVYWVTQPPMRDRDLDEGVRIINDIVEEVLSERDDVEAIDIWSLFGGDGPYQDRVAGPSGDTITARVDDGVHLSRPAASWVADLVFAALERRFRFES